MVHHPDTLVRDHRLAQAYRLGVDAAGHEQDDFVHFLADVAGIAIGEGMHAGERDRDVDLQFGWLAQHGEDGVGQARQLGIQPRAQGILDVLDILGQTTTRGQPLLFLHEIEHGLEPHRIIGAIAQLKGDQAKAATDKKPVGHVLMTTHSDVALSEAGEKSLHVIKTTRPDHITSVTTPATPQSLRPLLRFTPRALFARRILVCECYTEVGLLLGLREHWPTRHDNMPIEQLGAAIADGNGGEACAMALALAKLGYLTALYRDSDDPLLADQQTKLAAAGIPVFEYGGGLYTELAIFSAASDARVQELLQHAREERGDDFIDNNLAAKIDDLNVECIRLGFDSWELLSAKNGEELRAAIAEVAASKGKEKKDKKPWFKDQRLGRGLAPFVWSIVTEAPASPLAAALTAAEAWLYA